MALCNRTQFGCQFSNCSRTMAPVRVTAKRPYHAFDIFNPNVCGSYFVEGDICRQYDKNFTNTWRYYNEIDIVPYSATDIIGLGDLYDPPAPSAHDISVTYDGKTVTLAEAFDIISGLIVGSELYYDSAYTHVNQKRGSVALNTGRHVFPVSSSDPLFEQWFLEAGQQHAHNNYLNWLGEAPLNCG